MRDIDDATDQHGAILGHSNAFHLARALALVCIVQKRALQTANSNVRVTTCSDELRAEFKNTGC